MSKKRIFVEMVSGHRYKVNNYKSRRDLSEMVNLASNIRKILVEVETDYGTQSINILNIDRVYEVETNN